MVVTVSSVEGSVAVDHTDVVPVADVVLVAVVVLGAGKSHGGRVGEGFGGRAGGGTVCTWCGVGPSRSPARARTASTRCWASTTEGRCEAGWSRMRPPAGWGRGSHRAGPRPNSLLACARSQWGGGGLAAGGGAGGPSFFPLPCAAPLGFWLLSACSAPRNRPRTNKNCC